MPPTSSQTAKRLDPHTLATSALEIADTEGLEALTIRRLAQLHDVTPMALYRHFNDKEALLAAVGDRILADIALPSPTDEAWEVQLQAVLTAFVKALRPHPKAAGLTLYRILVSPDGLALAERTMELLVAGGFSTDYAAEVGRQSVCSLITLVTAEPGATEDIDPVAREDGLRAKRASLAALSPHRYPLITAAADTLICPASHDQYYSLGVDLVVAGIRGVRARLQA
ncbi:TetR/AcrR family transcriptional regulator C-terminal domain-containing protein [Kribbella sp. NBC_00382]|uniref:TetR/AcrR family transcriptional regulator n=1 Tax=Kribbella sp. NBC_00382 TaxID=2975967 RepID=UPI002E1A30D7